MTIINV